MHCVSNGEGCPRIARDVSIIVTDMSCEMCSVSVRNALKFARKLMRTWLHPGIVGHLEKFIYV